MKIAIVRVRGQLHIRHDIKTTLTTLKLNKKNTCVILEETPANKGMIQKAKNFVTYGPINEETQKKINAKYPNEKTYHLSPPTKGFGRKGIKLPFHKGGALGDRGEKINDLLNRMIR